MYGTIGFSPESDWEHNLGYKLIQLNRTGEFWQMLFGVDDNHGQPYVAHNGSETGSGVEGQYTWKLFFPDENGTLATKEWSYGELSGKVDTNDLSSYLPLSGGTLSGALEVTGLGKVVLDTEAAGGYMILTDGSDQNPTYYHSNFIGTSYGNLYFPVGTPDDYTLATQEYVISALGDIESILEAI